jgi:choline dehydrogenase-like flavoprotein
MIEDLQTSDQHVKIEAELAIVGAGPAGIVTALEAAKHGISVVLLETGGRSFDPTLQDLTDAAEWDRHRHAALSLTVRRQVGEPLSYGVDGVCPSTRLTLRSVRFWVHRLGL